MKLTKKELEAKVEELEASVSSWKDAVDSWGSSWWSLEQENRENLKQLEKKEKAFDRLNWLFNESEARVTKLQASIEKLEMELKESKAKTKSWKDIAKLFDSCV